VKEYALFIKENGDAEMYCGGQFFLGASTKGRAGNIATLWNALDAFGERVIQLSDTGIDPASGEQTFRIKTLPKSGGTHERRRDDTEDAIDESCGYLGGGPAFR
jgi:hypothetical protein